MPAPTASHLGVVVVLIVGPSGLELDVEESVAAGLVDGGHAEYVAAVEPSVPVAGSPDVEDVAVNAGDGDVAAVEPSVPDSVERPKGNAGVAEWVAYASAHGKNVDGLSRDEIRALFKG